MHPQDELTNIIIKGLLVSTQANYNTAGEQSAWLSILAKPSYSVTSHSTLLQPRPSNPSATEVKVIRLATNRDCLYGSVLKRKPNYLTVA